MHDFRIVFSQDLTKFQWEDKKNMCDEEMWLKYLYTYTTLSMQNTRFIVNYYHSWWTIIEPVWVANNIVLSFGLNLCLQMISHRPTIFTPYLQFRASFKIIKFKSCDQRRTQD